MAKSFGVLWTKVDFNVRKQIWQAVLRKKEQRKAKKGMP